MPQVALREILLPSRDRVRLAQRVGRAREGGSWLVRVALARIGRWIVDRGVVPEDSYKGLANELPETELRALLAEMDAPDGRIRYLAPVVRLSETAPRWSRPPVPLGYHEPAWPPRDAPRTEL